MLWCFAVLLICRSVGLFACRWTFTTITKRDRFSSALDQCGLDPLARYSDSWPFANIFNQLGWAPALPQLARAEQKERP